MKIFIADAFTDHIFSGNPAGVVLLENGTDFPNDAVMLKTAAELRYSETAFVKPLPGNEFQLRYITPAAEVDFCGHATIGTFAALLKSGFVREHGMYLIHTLSGKLMIEISSGFIMMEMPSPKLLKRICTSDEIAELYRVLGIEGEIVAVNTDNGSLVKLLPILIDTGFADLFLPVKNRETLAAISPDFDRLSALCEKHGAGGVHAFVSDTTGSKITAASGTNEITAYCRNFAPLFGITEEAATGTASGGLTYYLYINGMVYSGQDCCFLQGEALKRPSKIYTSIQSVGTQTESVRIKVGGKGAVLAAGEIYL